MYFSCFTTINLHVISLDISVNDHSIGLLLHVVTFHVSLQGNIYVVFFSILQAIDMEQLRSCSPLSSSNYQANVGMLDSNLGAELKGKGEDDDDHI